MGVTDKTRKLLGGKSGNRGAKCRHVLCIDATREDDESIVEEHVLFHLITTKGHLVKK
jgi:hypothetical protein